jgi:hypothetical protein
MLDAFWVKAEGLVRLFALCPFAEHKCIAGLFWVEHLLGDLRTGDREALDWEQAHLDKDRSLIPIDVLVG